jgi:hypothetical protein
MSGTFPRAFVFLAFSVALIASALLGMVIWSSFRPVSSTSSVPRTAYVTLMVQGDLMLGPDNKTHDTFVPSNFTVYAGQIVNLTIINYDLMPHSFTSPGLNVDFQIPSSQTDGVPMFSHFQFSELNSGIYRWWCAIPCDTDANGWAMSNGNDGQPGQIGYMGGFVTVLES